MMIMTMIMTSVDSDKITSSLGFRRGHTVSCWFASLRIPFALLIPSVIIF